MPLSMNAVPQLETARFVLRPLRREDAGALLPTLSDERQCRFLSRPAFTDEAELRGWLAEPGWPGRTWIAAARESGDVAARVVAVPRPEPGTVEIGYITVAGWQGRGVARECVSALVRYLIEREGAQKIVAEVDVENAPSVRLLDALGFALETLFRGHEVTHKGLCDVATYALLAEGRRSRRPG